MTEGGAGRQHHQPGAAGQRHRGDREDPARRHSGGARGDHRRQIDIYPEYTGNAAFFFNKADDPLWNDAAKAYEEAKKLDYDANKIVWLSPAPANNTWAVALRQELADANGIATFSDFGKYRSPAVAT